MKPMELRVHVKRATRRLGARRQRRTLPGQIWNTKQRPNRQMLCWVTAKVETRPKSGIIQF